jgi:MFS transporter, NNP family, nitrate/nitrite transporter
MADMADVDAKTAPVSGSKHYLNYEVLPADQDVGTQPLFTLRKPVVDEQYRARSLQILSLARPHARAFNLAWFSFFLSFCGWFALSPILNRIKKTNKWLTKKNTFNSNVVAVAGTILMRLTIGPVCDRFGPRISMASILIVFSIPVAAVSLAHSFAVFTTIRFFIGFIGASFVVVQFWTSMMYSGPVVGTANAVSAGWGNLGGGFINAVMPLLVQGIQNTGRTSDQSWRLAQIVPALLLFVTGFLVYFTDDAPQGNYADLHREGTKTKTNPYVAMLRACKNYRTWILFLVYGACFGVEVLMNLNMATYIEDRFDASERTAGLIAGIVGLMNFFARALGGVYSDTLAKKMGMRGRIWALWSVLVLEGIFLIVFARMGKLSIAVVMVVFFALFVDMGAGGTFGIVPFVDPEATGSVCGVVGAGGNVGAVVGGLMLRGWGRQKGFEYVGYAVLIVAMMLPLLHFAEHGSMLFAPAKVAGDVVEDDA